MMGLLINKSNGLYGTLSDYGSLSGTLSFYVDDLTYSQAINLGFVGTKNDLLDLIISSVEGIYYLNDESNNYLTDEKGNILFT